MARLIWSVLLLLVGQILAEHVDSRMAGSFVFDKSRSDSIEPLLVAEGIPWFYRKIAVKIVPTWVVTFEGDNNIKLLVIAVHCTRLSF
jgi:hypothetical protein